MNGKTKRILFCVFVFVAGCLAGILSKYLDTVPGDGTPVHNLMQTAGQLLSELPFWVFVGCVIAYYSRTAKAAAVHTPLFFAGLLISYYIYTAVLFSVLPAEQVLRWAIFAGCASLAGYTVWYAGKKGWPPALCTAVPIGYLITEGYPVFYTYDIKDMAALVMAACLYVMMPRSKDQKLRVLPLTGLVVFIIIRFDLVAWLFGGL